MRARVAAAMLLALTATGAGVPASSLPPPGSDPDQIAWLLEMLGSPAWGQASLQPFRSPLVEMPHRAPGGVRLQRNGGEAVFSARPLPLPARATVLEPQGGAIVVEPEDLASISWQPPPGAPPFDGSIVLSAERPLSGGGALLLAEMIQGAARLGASGLVLVRPAPGDSLYESLLIEGRSDPFDLLPLSGPAPGILVLSAGPELGMEILGQGAFAKLSAPPELDPPAPRFRPWLLDLQVGAWASFGLIESEGANVVVTMEGSDADHRREVVVLSTVRAPARPGGAALLASIARALDGEPRPARGIVLAALDPLRGALPATAALAGWLDESGLKPAAVIAIDLGAPSEIPQTAISLATEPLEAVARKVFGASGLAVSPDDVARPDPSARASGDPAASMSLWTRREIPVLMVRPPDDLQAGAGEAPADWARAVASLARSL